MEKIYMELAESSSKFSKEECKAGAIIVLSNGNNLSYGYNVHSLQYEKISKKIRCSLFMRKKRQSKIQLFHYKDQVFLQHFFHALIVQSKLLIQVLKKFIIKKGLIRIMYYFH